MQQKKGYDGVSKKRKERREHKGSLSSDVGDGEDCIESVDVADEVGLEQSLGDAHEGMIQYETRLLLKMSKELKQLQAKIKAIKHT